MLCRWYRADAVFFPWWHHLCCDGVIISLGSCRRNLMHCCFLQLHFFTWKLIVGLSDLYQWFLKSAQALYNSNTRGNTCLSTFLTSLSYFLCLLVHITSPSATESSERLFWRSSLHAAGEQHPLKQLRFNSQGYCVCVLKQINSITLYHIIIVMSPYFDQFGAKSRNCKSFREI